MSSLKAAFGKQKKKFPESAGALDGWYRVIKKNEFNNFAELKKVSTQ